MRAVRSGEPLVDRLRANQHEVFALTQSRDSAAVLTEIGAEPVIAIVDGHPSPQEVWLTGVVEEMPTGPNFLGWARPQVQAAPAAPAATVLAGAN